jgi:broad specificity phosphatase PhoE
MRRRGDDRWPKSLWLVRHGESSGNVARDLAEGEGRSVIDIAIRDMDVPLSPLGEDQARAVRQWFTSLPDDSRPTAAITSPYVRAEETARIAFGDDLELIIDERLREREFGILDRLTRVGITERYPEQAAARAFLGKFFHRPPGGESWADVALRLRSFVDTLGREHGGDRVVIVTHQVVILVFRYLLERLREAEILAIDTSAEVANCSITTYSFDPGGTSHGQLQLVTFNDVMHLRDENKPITTEPDLPRGPR